MHREPLANRVEGNARGSRLSLSLTRCVKGGLEIHRPIIYRPALLATLCCAHPPASPARDSTRFAIEIFPRRNSEQSAYICF